MNMPIPFTAVLVTTCLAAACGRPTPLTQSLEDRISGVWKADVGSFSNKLFELREGMMVIESGAVFATYQVIDHETIKFSKRRGSTELVFKVEFVGTTMYWTSGLVEDRRRVWTFRRQP